MNATSSPQPPSVSPGLPALQPMNLGLRQRHQRGQNATTHAPTAPGCPCAAPAAASAAPPSTSAATTQRQLAAAAAARSSVNTGAGVNTGMNASVSVIETLLRELRDRPGTLQFDDGLPYDFDALLTPAGLKYAQEPSNLERYWRLHAGTFKPAPFEGSWTRPANGRTQFEVSVTAPSVTVIVVPPVSLVESH